MSNNTRELSQAEEKEILSCISDVLLSNPSVSRLSGSLTAAITRTLLRGDGTDGIKLNYDKGGLEITISLIVYYGINIPQLSYDIQTSIRNRLENEVGCTIKAINIVVEGIDRKQVLNNDKREDQRKHNADYIPDGYCGNL